MTRSFRTQATCSHCGNPTTLETPFERWIRAQPDLDSVQTGLVRFDLDILLHRYKFLHDGRGSRQVQALMFVEAKSYMAEPSASQRDTLNLLNQVLRNRRQNIHQRPGRQIQHTLLSKAYSTVMRQDIDLWLRGGHLLQLEGTRPTPGERLLWDGREIDTSVLKGLFRFEIDADSLRPIDMRRRYQSWDAPQSEFFVEP